MTDTKYTFIPLTESDEEDRIRFEKLWPQHRLVGFLQCPEITKIVLKMRPGYKGWTPYMTVRDCGDHYILAMYAEFNRLDKKTMQLTYDVEDK